MLFSDSFKTIASASESLVKEKGSKFYAFAYPVKTEEEFKLHLRKLKLKYPDATHHCYALVLNPDKSFQKSNDDGEPSNTAGKPILRAILANDLTNIAIIVVRYFGGTMLGVPGLINAYNHAALSTIKQAGTIEIAIEDMYELQCALANEGDAHRFIKKLDAKIISSAYDENFHLKFSLPRAKANRIEALKEEFYFLKVVVG